MEKNVSDDFIFSFKASRVITHLKKLTADEVLLDKFFTPLAPFAQKRAKHLILFQTPPFLKVNQEKLKLLFSFLPKTFLYAFELRHPSWFNKEIYEIFKKNNTAVVLSDSPIKAKLPVNNRLWPYVNVETANFFYIRLHGSKRLFSSSYTDCELKYYAKLIKNKLKKGLNVYCYFNNDVEGFATKNAQRLKKFLGL